MGLDGKIKKVMCCSPNEELLSQVGSTIRSLNADFLGVASGKQCRTHVHANTINYFILDLSCYDVSPLELVHHYRSTRPFVSILLLAEDEDHLKHHGLAPELLKSVGLNFVSLAPHTVASLQAFFEGSSDDGIAPPSTPDGTEILAADADYEEVSVDQINGLTTSDLDLFLKLAPGRFVKVVNAGSCIQSDFLEKLTGVQGVTKLYYRHSCLAAHGLRISDDLGPLIKNRQISSRGSMRRFQRVIEDQVAALAQSDLNPDHLKESLAICEEVYTFVQRRPEINKHLHALEEQDPASYQQQFLTAVYSSLIAQDVPWSSKRTTEYSTFGSLFQSVGKLHLPDGLKRRQITDLTPEELQEFQQYPRLGYNILVHHSVVPEPVRQVIYQHRELVNGQGFPNRLRYSQMYPLAKIASTAFGFSQVIDNFELGPLDALRTFATDRFTIGAYDADSVRSLIKCFIKKKENAA